MRIRWLTFEHSPAAYRADFVIYGAAAAALAAALLLAGPVEPRLIGWAVAGALGWTLLEYLLHRFVLHGLPPFKSWHAEHHRHPAALIASPTLLTATLFSTLVQLPAVWLLGVWPAAALSFGAFGGYLAYALTHHAIHHPAPPQHAPFTRIGQRWLQRRRQWHGLHHRRMHETPGGTPPSPRVGYYGVSSAFWDRVFGTDRRTARIVFSAACRAPTRTRP